MEMKTILKQVIVIFLLIVACFMLQTTIFPHFELAGVVPNFLVILTASFGLMRGTKYGMGVGFACGLVADFFSGSYLGMYILIYLYIGFLSGLFKRLFYGDDLKLPLALIGTCDIVYGLIIYGIWFLMRKQFAFGYYFFNVIMPEAVYTILVSIFLYYIILKINQWFDKDEKRSGRDLV